MHTYVARAARDRKIVPCTGEAALVCGYRLHFQCLPTKRSLVVSRIVSLPTFCSESHIPPDFALSRAYLFAERILVCVRSVFPLLVGALELPGAIVRTPLCVSLRVRARILAKRYPALW